MNNIVVFVIIQTTFQHRNVGGFIWTEEVPVWQQPAISIKGFFLKQFKIVCELTATIFI